MLELGRYRLVRQIGRGGMAEIWKAKASGPSGFVKFLALKMILPDIADDRLFVAMFVDEAKLAASLVHPNLVTVFDFGEIDQRLFLAMEYVAGANLDRLMSRLHKEGGVLPVEIALYVALEACRGLGHAHARTGPDGELLGVVHRDVSPQNVLISSTGDVKVGDFGIAKAASVISRTAAGQVRGKLAYMSPEQLDNQPLDGRTDLFSLGIVLYEMLTGVRLFRGRSSEEVSDRVRHFNPTADLDFDRVPASVRQVLVVLLQPDRDKRHRDAAELEAELGERLGLPGIARARTELGALVTRLFRDELAADARDERDDEPEQAETLANAFGAAPMVTKLEVPTGSRPRRTGPTATPETPAPVGEVAGLPEPRPSPGSRRRTVGLVLGSVALAGAGLVTWRVVRHGAHGGGPTRGGTLHIAMAFAQEDFDMFSQELSRTRHTLTEVVDPLLHLDRDGTIAPWTIERYELSHGNKTVTLHLRAGVTFHDHPCLPGGAGREATAEDVAYSLRLAVRNDALTLPIRGGEAYRKGAPALEGIAVTGPLDVALEFTDPAPFYETEIANVHLLPHELDGCEDVRRMKQPVGTGPFRFTGPTHGARMDLVRASHYWRRADDGGELPYLDGIQVQPVEDMRDALSRMTHPDLDIVMPGEDDWPQILDLSMEHTEMLPRFAALGLDAATTSSRSRVSLLGLIVGTHDSPMLDRPLRRAFAMALDRKALVAVNERALGGPTGRFMDARMLGYDPNLTPVGLDLDASRALLADAGHANGAGLRPIRIGTMHNQTVANLIAKQAAAIGFDVKVVSISPAKAIESLQSGDVDMLLVTNNWAMYEGENAGLIDENDRYRMSPELAKLRLELTSAADRADRAPIYRKIEAQLVAEMTVIPVAWGDTSHPLDVFVVRRDVRGFHDPLTGYARVDNLEHTWLDR